MSDRITRYMEQLWAKGKERQRLTGHLVALVGRLANEIAQSVPTGTRVKVDGVGVLQVVNYRSNVGNLHRLVVVEGDDERWLSVEDCEPGSSYFLHGDFNCRINVAKPRHFLSIANHMCEILVAFGATEDRAIGALRDALAKLRQDAEGPKYNARGLHIAPDVRRYVLSENAARRIREGENFVEVCWEITDNSGFPAHDDLRWDGGNIEAIRCTPDGAHEVVAIIEIPVIDRRG